MSVKNGTPDGFSVSALRSHLMRSGAGTLALRIANLLLEMLAAIVLARSMGSHGYGIYAYAFALMRVLAIPAQAGLPTLAVREVASYVSSSNWPKLRGFLVRVNQTAVLFSLGIAMAAGMVGLVLKTTMTQEQVQTYFWALALLPLIALGNIRGAVLRGLHMIVKGLLPENVLRPLFFIVLVVAAWGISGGVTPQLAMAFHALGAALAFAIGAWLLVRYLPEQVKAASPSYETRRWLLSAFPLSMIMGMMVINNQAAILILGLSAPASEVGVYGAVSQVALVVTVPLTVVNLAVAPTVAKLFTEGNKNALQRVAAWSAGVILVAGIGTGLTLAFLARPILGIAFGPDFIVGAGALVVLCLGQSLSALFGASMILLNMTRNERHVAISFAVAVALNIVGNLILAPKYGLVGAAAAVATSLVVLNAILAWQVHRNLHLNPTVLGIPTRRQVQANGDG